MAPPPCRPQISSITAGSTVDKTSFSAAILNASNSLTLDSSTFEVGGTVNVTNTFTNNNGTLQAKFNTTINAATFTMTGTTPPTTASSTPTASP